jgi:SAM-dependent MidA family methyltransferase
MSLPKPFSQFMREALYEEHRGYYMSERDKFGAEGDFYTASQVHKLFGSLLAKEFDGVWRALDSPIDFTIVELGPGRGEFARDALSTLRVEFPDCFRRLRYICCEISPVLRSKQRASLAEFENRVDWIVSLDELTSPVTGVFFANEFFDALPVHVVRWRSGRLREVYVVRRDDGRLVCREDELSSTRLEDYWERVGSQLSEEQLAEINIDAVEWMERIALRLQRGRVITIDYGDIAERLYTDERPNGTLRCFSRHWISDEPLERIGEQDITASVNFTALMEYGRDFGLEVLSFARQTDHLIGLGLLDRAAALSVKAAQGHESSPELQHRLALKQLFVPEGMSSHFRVLVQEKR